MAENDGRQEGTKGKAQTDADGSVKDQRPAVGDQAKVSKSTTSKADRSKLSPAAESSDQAVQELLARRQAAAMNSDQDAIDVIDADLAKRGYWAD